MIRKINKLYLIASLPKWHKRYTNGSKITLRTLEEITNTIKTKNLSKQDVKNLLLSIQKDNIKKNKKKWDYLLENKLPRQYSNSKIKVNKISNFTAIIVEARKHPHFKVVVQNMITHTQKHKPCLQIYHGNQNESFVKKQLEGIKNIQFINMNIANLNIESYNNIILSKDFWLNIKSEKALIFQTDTISFKPLDKQFLNYDYIGAPWKENLHKTFNAKVGNGGLSIRSTKAMLEIINQNIKRIALVPEDLYLAQILIKQNYNIASYKCASEFSVEGVFTENSFGCHKPWELLTIEQMEKLVAQ